MSNRIKSLRIASGKTLKRLSEETGIPISSLSEYETTERQPKKEIWDILASHFNVSVPYLMGLDASDGDMISISVGEYKRLKELEQQLNQIKQLLK